MAAELARRQHGVVARRQLLDRGFSDDQVELRLRRGSLQRLHPGVYAVGDLALPALGRAAAAILACSPRAYLSHATAAAIWGLARLGAGDVELTLVARRRRNPAGVRVHWISELAPGELRRHEGLPVSSPSLTILDVASRLPPDRLADLVHGARHRRLVGLAELRATLAAHPRRRGAGALRRLLAGAETSLAVESRAEARCLRLMVRHGLRPDASQVAVGPYRVDFLYRRERLIVEVEGYRHHGGRRPFDADRRRASYLLARGYAIFPVTWTDLTRDPEGTMRRLRAALAARREPAPHR